MTKEQLKQILNSNILLISGIFEPEKLEHMEEIFAEYMESGCNILLAPTYFSKNQEQKEKIIEQTQKIASDCAFVAGVIQPCREGIALTGGTKTYEDYYEQIKLQAEFFATNSVSMIFLLDFTDILEAKCAVLACKEACDLPVCVGFSFDESLKLKGLTDAVNAVITMQSLGVSAVGYGFGTNMDDALEVIMAMKEFAAVPLFALPNVSEFMPPEEFASYLLPLVNHKCALIGGARGSNERYVAYAAKQLWQLMPFSPDFETIHAATSISDVAFFDFEHNIIGKTNRLVEIKIEKSVDVDAIIERLIQTKFAPVCFSVTDMDALIKVLKHYPGRPMIQSDEYGNITAKEYGAVLMPQKEE